MTDISPLIGVDELAGLPPADVLPVDCRFSLADADYGRREFAAGHLPGAVYADLDTELSTLPAASPELGRHPLPSPALLAAALGRWGWRPGMLVVAYDAANGAMVAARLWWLLRMAGIPVRVLDGGLAAWAAAGHAIETEEVARMPTRVEIEFDMQRIVDTPTLQQGLHEERFCLIDARGESRYRGDEEPIDPVAGHVPGALNRPFTENVTADGRFKSAAELRAAFLDLIGGHDPAQIVHMCGSGVTACHNLLAMEHAGLAGSRLYPPSWSGWVADRLRPVATGG